MDARRNSRAGRHHRANLGRLARRHPGRDLSARVEPQLVEDAADVAVDGAFRDEKTRSDLLVAQAVGDQAGDVELSFRKQSRSCITWSRGGRVVRFAEGDGDGTVATYLLAAADFHVEPGFAERRDDR